MSNRKRQQLTWTDAMFFAMTVVGIGGFVYMMVYR
jgi:hypothetical protein